MRSARVLALFVALGAGCGGEPDPGPCTPFVVVPDRVTLFLGGGRDVKLLRSEPGAPLEALDAEAIEALSEDPRVVAFSGGRLRGLAPGETAVLLGERECAQRVRVEVLPTPAYATAVVARSRGLGDGFGQERFPEVVLGPPAGGGPYQGSFDVLSLGIGGSITLAFDPELSVYDGPGPDLIVFENPFRFQGRQESFAEPAVVEVALGDEELRAFPCDGTSWPYPGCAGVSPVAAGPLAPQIDPTDPSQAGGDAFDLEGLATTVDRIRITDVATGTITGNSSGFDLDAVAAVNAFPRAVVGLVPAQEVLRASSRGQALLPRFDARTEDGGLFFGIPVRIEASEGIEISGPLITVEGAPSAELRVSAGSFSTSVTIEVKNEE